MDDIDFNNVSVPDWCNFTTDQIKSSLNFDINKSSGIVSFNCIYCNKKKFSAIGGIRRRIKDGQFTTLCSKCRGILQRRKKEYINITQVPIFMENWLKENKISLKKIENNLNSGKIVDVIQGNLVNRGIEFNCIKCNSKIKRTISGIKSCIRNKKFTGLCRKCLSTVLYKVNPNNPRLSKGYVLIQKSLISKKHSHIFTGWFPTYKHRYEMSLKLNRPLKKNEIVHHIDGNKLNNSIENLELWNTSHPSGQRIKDKIKWCREFLNEYKNEFPNECFGIKIEKRPIKGVIFDMDGTIVDLTNFHFNILNSALVFCNYNPISTEDHVNLYNGLTTKEKLKRMNFSDDEIININNQKQKFTISELQKMDLYDKEIEDIFYYIYNKKLKIAIATNSVKNTVNIVVDKMRLYKYCDVILSNQNIDYPKPNPDIYLTICKKWKVFPNEVLGIEDGVYGKESVLRAGLNLFPINSRKDLTLKKIKELI